LGPTAACQLLPERSEPSRARADKGERDAWLRIWANAVPQAALAVALEGLRDETMRAEVARLGPVQVIRARGSSSAMNLLASAKGSATHESEREEAQVSAGLVTVSL
jgi:hypothetical protein